MRAPASEAASRCTMLEIQLEKSDRATCMGIEAARTIFLLAKTPKAPLRLVLSLRVGASSIGGGAGLVGNGFGSTGRGVEGDVARIGRGGGGDIVRFEAAPR